MNQDDVIRLAVQCQLLTTGNREGIYADALECFANLVAEHERSECAKLCDEIDKESQSQWPRRFATMIRARGQA